MNNNMNTTRMSRILKDLYYLHFFGRMLQTFQNATPSKRNARFRDRFGIVLGSFWIVLGIVLDHFGRFFVATCLARHGKGSGKAFLSV